VGRGHDTCARCSGPSALRNPRPIEGECRVCKDRVCKRHLRWLEGWICTRCLRRARQAAAAARGA
jgi:hypothetical protein